MYERFWFRLIVILWWQNFLSKRLTKVLSDWSCNCCVCDFGSIFLKFLLNEFLLKSKSWWCWSLLYRCWLRRSSHLGLDDWRNHKIWCLNLLYWSNHLLLGNNWGRWLNLGGSCWWLSNFYRCCSSSIDLSRCFCDCSSNCCGIHGLTIFLLLSSDFLGLSNKSSLDISIRGSLSGRR